MLPGIEALRPEERRGTAAAFLTSLGVLAAHTILETARDALFLTTLPARQLALVYLVIALVAAAVSQIPWSRRRAKGAFGLALLLGAEALVTVLFWAVSAWQSPAGLYALYVWTGLAGSLAVVQFWMILGDLYTVTQAKRVYRLVGIGSLLGAVVGALGARWLAQHVTTSSLVLASGLVLAVTAVGPSVALGRAAGPASAATRGSASLGDALRTLGSHPYVRGLAGLVLISTVALTLGDYVFKSAVVRYVPRQDLGSFFAGLYAVLNLLALGTQVLLTGWLFRVAGLHRALWVLPAFLFLGAAGVALGGGLGAALLLKGADGALRNSLHRTGSELLFVPLPDALRARAKPIIDLVGQRGGQALASFLLLSELLLDRGDTVVAGAAAALSLVWIAWSSDLRDHYLDLFRSSLREGAIRPAVDLPPIDLGSLESLFAALNSEQDTEVLAALDLLAEEGRTRLIPALVLHHPSRDVVLRALDLFAHDGRPDFVPVADRLLRHPDPEIRAAALRARTRVRPEPAPLEAAVADPSPLVRATAVAGLVPAGWGGGDAAARLEGLVRDGSSEAHAALARAIAAQPAPVFEDVLLRLADSSYDEVLAETALAMGAVRSPRFLAPLLPLLASREVRPHARAALLAHGAAGLESLDRALGDHALPLEVRRHLPRTISLFPPKEAAAVLQRHLLLEPVGAIRYRILRGLNRLAASAEVELDREALREATAATTQAVFRVVHWRIVLARGARARPDRATPGHELLVRFLRDRETHATERLFRLLALQFRGEDFKALYRGLHAEDPRARASGRELLENLLTPPLREAALGIVDEAPDARRLDRAGPFYDPPDLDYESVLALMLEQGSESLRCLTSYHVGELGLVRMRSRLEALRSSGSGFFLARVVERALAALEDAGGGLARA